MVLENRVVYRIPEMDEVQVQRNVRYHAVNDTDLKMDLFYPPNMEPGSRLPAVIFVFGFPRARLKLKDSNAYVTWAQLTAASGLIAVLYETEQPETDVNELFGYIRENAASLKIDEDRIGIWSCSSNVPTALSLLMKDSGNIPKCAVLYYGLMLVGETPPTLANLQKEHGFVTPNQRRSYDDLRLDAPLFIVRAGLDWVPDLNVVLERFIQKVVSRNIPLVFHNYADGQHAFDLLDDNDESREIIKQTIGFMRTHLIARAHEEINKIRLKRIRTMVYPTSWFDVDDLTHDFDARFNVSKKYNSWSEATGEN